MDPSRRRLLGSLAALVGGCASARPDFTLLNVSFDATRELYRELNAAFAARWRAERGQEVVVHQSHGGSGKQARGIIFGLEGDVVSLALAFDVDRIAKESRRVATDWRARLPHGAAPFHSTVVFVVRKGNPHRVRDWDDLARPGLGLVLPNPKISGAARYNYLGAWAHALRRSGGDEARARAFLASLYRKVETLDPSARAAATTFAQRQMGDVLVSWESEARLLAEKFPREIDVVTPSVSVRADLPVALVEDTVDRRRTREVATAYLRFHYEPEAQRIAARHHFRPREAVAATALAAPFPDLGLLSVQEVAGGWEAANARHFKDRALFDQIFLTP